MADVDTMPPVTLDSADTDEDRRKRVANILPLSPAAAAPPAATMPAITPGSATPWVPPPPKPQLPPILPSPSAQIYHSGDLTKPTTSLKPLQSMPPVQAGPETQRYNELSQQGQPELHGWKKALDVVGSLFKGGQAIEQAIPGTPQNYNAKLGQQAMKAEREQSLGKSEQESETAAAQARFNTPEKRRAFVQANPDLFEGADEFQINDFVAQGKFPSREQAPPKEANLQQDYAAAVRDAQARGVDPAKDEKVQQIADAITGLQKQPAPPKDMTAKAGTLNGQPTWAIQTDQGWIDADTRKPIHGFQPQQPAGVGSPTDVRDIAAGIIGGQLPPDLATYGYRDRTAITAELKRQGFDLTRANQDWKATQRYLASLNGPQQVRYRQAVDFATQSLDQAQRIFDWWQKAGATAGWKTFNKASLAVAKQLPGQAGSAANNLEAAIADLTSELGTVYKGGNSSTDESLKLAAKNLNEDWNEQTFADAMKRIHESIGYRQNSMNHLPPAGVSENSPYTPPNEKPPQDFGAAPAGKKDGDTGKMKVDGKDVNVVVKGGRVIAAQ